MWTYTTTFLLTGYVGLIMQYRCDCKLEYRLGYYKGTQATGCRVVTTLASEYPHSTLKGTLTCSSHNSTAPYEITYLESWCVTKDRLKDRLPHVAHMHHSWHKKSLSNTTNWFGIVPCWSLVWYVMNATWKVNFWLFFFFLFLFLFVFFWQIKFCHTCKATQLTMYMMLYSTGLEQNNDCSPHFVWLETNV